MNSGQHLEPGVRIEGYRIESVLGQGGFGVTYLAVDESLDKRVAIKEYLPSDWAIRVDAQTVGPRSGSDRDDYEWGLERFLDEARALARFEHPHINRVHRHFSAHGTAYLVLEYIEGEPLSDRLRRQGTLSPEALRQLLAEMGSALAAVHQAGYVHRDIKPGNILLREDGRAVLVDFGAARQAVGSRSRNITQILTPGYAPIEQYDSKGTDIGPWTDVYALAVVAYRCVTGCGDADLVEANTRARKVFYGEPDPLVPAVKAARKGYPPALLRAIDQGLVIQERERPQDVGDWIGEAVKPDADAAPRTRPTEPPRHAASADAGVGDRGAGSPDDGRAGSASEARRAPPRTAMVVLLVAAVVVGAIAIPWLFTRDYPWTSAGGEDTAADVASGDADSSEAAAGTPEATTGRLVIRSNVRDDRAFIDGEAVGPTGPKAHVLDPGRYRVRVVKQGLESWDGKAEVQAGETTRVMAELASAPFTDDRAARPGETGLDTRVFRIDTTKALREAVAAADTGDTLELAPGEYAGPLTLDKLLLVRGMGSEPQDVVIDHDGDNSTLTIERDSSTLENLTIRYSGKAAWSAVWVRNNASPYLRDVYFEISDGGIAGLAVSGESRPQVHNAVFRPTGKGPGTSADSNAIIVANQARPTIGNSRFVGFSKPVIGVTDAGAPVVKRNQISFSGGAAVLIMPGAGGSFRNNSINASGSKGKSCIVVGKDSTAEFIDNFILDCAILKKDGSKSRFSGNTVRTTE